MNREMCERSTTVSSTLASLGTATFVSLILSSISAFVCLLFAGAGHAAASPGLVFFGPVFAYSKLVDLDSQAAAHFINFAVVFIFFFYAVYGIAICSGRLVRHGRLALVVVLVIHYCGVGVCIMSRDWDGMRNIWMISQMYGGWITVLLVELFVTLHLLAFQYAWSRFPYRPRIDRSAGVVLGVGLVAGIVFHEVTRMLAQY